MRPGPGLHAIAVIDGQGLDWQGTVRDLIGYEIVSPRRFAMLARQAGHAVEDLEADRAWAAEVIRLAYELAAEAGLVAGP